MKRLFRILVIAGLLAVAWTIYINAEEPVPLSEIDKREILVRLEELRLLRMELEIERKYIQRDQEQDQREQEVLKKQVENETRARQLAEKETAVFKEQADHYKQAYEALIKKGSKWCTVKKIFTLGIARCR